MAKNKRVSGFQQRSQREAEERRQIKAGRRRFLKLSLGAAGALATYGLYQWLGPPTSSTSTKQGTSEKGSYSINDVRTGIVTPTDYITELSQRLPEVRQAKESGSLIDFIYSPSDMELEAILTEYFESRTDSQEARDYFVQISKDEYQRSATGRAVASGVLPGVMGLFGQKQPLYVAFSSQLLTSEHIRNDADVRSLVNHELQHNEDWYNGITLGDIHLSRDTIGPATTSKEFIRNLAELRAVYRELRDMYQERVTRGSISISPEWLAGQAGSYRKYYTFVNQNASTNLEKEIRDRQLAEFKGIVPVDTGTNEYELRFNLFGKRDFVELQLK